MFRFRQTLTAPLFIGIGTFDIASGAQAAAPVPVRSRIQIRYYRHRRWSSTAPAYMAANERLFRIVAAIAYPYGDSSGDLAAVIDAQGRYLIQEQEAIRAQIENRQRLTDLQKQERQQRQKLDDKRAPQRQDKVGRAAIDPPTAEPALTRSPNARIDGGTKRVGWPVLLRRADFDSYRAELDELGGQAFSQANRGEVERTVLQEMSRRLDQLEKCLVNMARTAADKATWSASEYIEAKQFLRRYEGAIQTLGQAGAKEPVTRDRDLLLTQIRR
jgi:hypothetical protein